MDRKNRTKERKESINIKILVGARLAAFVQTHPGDHTAYCTIGNGFLARGQRGRDVALSAISRLTQRLKKE
jgi:hypothetical protein